MTEEQKLNQQIAELKAKLNESEQLHASKKGLEDKVAELEKQLSVQDQVIEEAKGRGQKVSVPVKGSFVAKWPDPSGKDVKKKVEFKNGFHKVRIPNISGIKGKEIGQIVPSEAVFRIAGGGEATKKELEQYPHLAGFVKEEAAAMLTYLAKLGAGFLKTLILILCFMGLSMKAEAQFGAAKYYSFAVDTLTNSDTLTFEFPQLISDLYYHSWQVNVDSLTGTTSATAYLEQTLCKSCTDWVRTDTLTYTASDADMINGTAWGLRQRLVIISSGTQSTAARVHLAYRKRKS